MCIREHNLMNFEKRASSTNDYNALLYRMHSLDAQRIRREGRLESHLVLFLLYLFRLDEHGLKTVQYGPGIFHFFPSFSNRRKQLTDLNVAAISSFVKERAFSEKCLRYNIFIAFSIERKKISKLRLAFSLQ